MKIASWNVNGIRAVIQKGFFDWKSQFNPDIICLQEVKAFENQIPTEVRFNLSEYDFLWHKWTRPGYAGTAIFFKKDIQIIEKKSDFPFDEFSDEWRVTQIDFQLNDAVFSLLNVYFPNGGSRADGTEMLSYKLDFYEKIRNYVQSLRNEKKLVIIGGDFNICHTEIDIARPKENEGSIWFLPIEREEMDKLANDWLVDIFRCFNPDLKDQYTWWSYRAWARPRNIWWRLDYFWTSPEIVNRTNDVQQQSSIMWSDHCPIMIDIK